MQFTDIKFNRDDEFYKTLQKRVRKYFKDNKISKYGDFRTVIKTIFMITLYLLPFVLLITVVESVWLSFIMWTLMGLGMAGIGMSIMHDANHGAYSKKKQVNRWLGKLISIVGGNETTWKIQHNVLHHTYTNVTGVDEDIDTDAIMRFSPYAPWKPHHRYQHIYAWFLYGMMTILWITAKDFKQVINYKKLGLLEIEKQSFARVFTTILISKILYYAIFLVLPLVFTPIPWYFTVLGFLLMHFLTGLFLGVIFQTGHVMPSSEFPVPDKSGNIEEDWAINQLYNTCNFAPKSNVLSWFIGGLNYQIEHHLFPGICHVHYKKISRIVQETATEFKLPYHSYKTLFSAVQSHTIMLKTLGRKEIV